MVLTYELYSNTVKDKKNLGLRGALVELCLRGGLLGVR